MNFGKLAGKKVMIAIDYNDPGLECHYPRLRLIEEGCEVIMVKFHQDIKIFSSGKTLIQDAGCLIDEDFLDDSWDGVIMPGGMVPEYLRRSKPFSEFLQRMDTANKVIVGLCHGVLILRAIKDFLVGRKVCSTYSIMDGLENAGAQCYDDPCILDQDDCDKAALITAKSIEDLPEMMRDVIDMLSVGQEGLGGMSAY